MLAIGRALMSDPDLLMLDEPSLGLAPIVVRDVFSVIAQIRENGRITLQGSGRELLQPDGVRRADLGV